MTLLAQTLRLCVIQHHPLETPGYVLNWVQARGMQVQLLHAWEFNEAAKWDEFDALIVLGGPYSVSDTSNLPWLAQELSWLKSCVAAKMPIFGICLGAQLLAHCLGAEVQPMTTPDLCPAAELGWVKIIMCDELAASAALAARPVSQASVALAARPVSQASAVLASAVRPVLQWHEESFQIPLGAKRLAHSVLGNCNQGFKAAERRLMGVQFHPEWSAATFATLIDGLADAETAAVLRAALGQTALFDMQEALCAALLDFWIQPKAKPPLRPINSGHLSQPQKPNP